MTRFALILGLLLCLTVPAAGQKGDLQRQIAEKQRAIDALEKQIARGEQELTSIKKGKNSEQQSVRRLSRQIASRRQLLDETESQLSLLAEQLAASDSTAGALNVRLERYRAQYAAMVREAYRNYKQNSYLTYIFASKDFADVARRIANIRGVAKLREAKLREIAETAQEVGRQQELLAAQQQALDSTRRKIDAQRARYERDQRNAKARLQRMSAREKAVLREKERQEEQLDTAIAELQKLTKGNKAGASFSTRTSNLNLPVEGGRVKRYRDNMAEITGPKGARITAIYEGKVVDVKRNRITNRFDVYIAHGQYITSYANLNSVSVAKGQTVAKNSAIGVIGPAVDIQTMKTEYRLVFGIYPPAGAKKMRASDCFRKEPRKDCTTMAVRYHTDGCSYRLPQKRLTAAWLRRVAEQEGYTLAEVDYIFCSAERLLEMNRQYLGHDYFTDVITFDYSDRRGTRTVAGDIFIDVETVADNARIYGATTLQEMRRVVVHGLLHLCGQRDKTPRTERQMHRKEDKYLRFWETPQK